MSNFCSGDFILCGVGFSVSFNDIFLNWFYCFYVICYCIRSGYRCGLWYLYFFYEEFNVEKRCYCLGSLFSGIKRMGKCGFFYGDYISNRCEYVGIFIV